MTDQPLSDLEPPAEQEQCLRDIERRPAADQTYLEEGIRVLELAKDAQRLFDKQEPRADS